MKENDKENKQPCSCTQTATDILKSVSPIKEGILKEARCKNCGKTFLTNFETELCFDCRRSQQR